jgi:hypothetical protein
LGVPDRFVEHASRHRQLEEVGLSAASIAERVCREIAGRCLSRSYSCSPIQPEGREKESTCVSCWPVRAAFAPGS